MVNLKKVKQRLKKSGEFAYFYFRKLPIQNHTILLESTQGADFSGHPAAVLKGLLHDKTLKIIIPAREDVFETIQTVVQLETRTAQATVKVIRFGSLSYMYYLATAKRLVNDTSFYPFFNKRSGQTYFNIWHGTPLKKMGKDEQPVGWGNVQHNLLSADYLIGNNDYMLDTLADAYNLRDIAETKLVKLPSPRNSALFGSEADSNNYIWMPTWHPAHTKEKFVKLLTEFSEKLPAGMQLLIKLHPFEDELLVADDLAHLPNITRLERATPIYEKLGQARGLITDYSSILFDVAGIQLPTVLFQFDKALYENDRGVYEEALADIPFSVTETVSDALDALQNFSETSDYKKFAQKYAPLDHANGFETVAHFILSEESDTITSVHNGKDNVLLFPGPLLDNGITGAFLNTLKSIDLSKRNYIVYIPGEMIPRQFLYKLEKLGVTYVLPHGSAQMGILQALMFYVRLSKERWSRLFNVGFLRNWSEEGAKYEFLRTINGLKTAWFIHYPGYERRQGLLVNGLKNSDIKTAIFVHSDMPQEYDVRHNFDAPIISRAYQVADKVVGVHQSMIDLLIDDKRFVDVSRMKGDFVVVNNFTNYQEVQRLAVEPVGKSLVKTPIHYSDNRQLEGDLTHLKVTDMTSNGIKSAYVLADIISHLEEKLPYVFINQTEILRDLTTLFRQDEVQFNTSALASFYGVSTLRLLNDLYNPNLKFFINVGRFSTQKAHDRVLKAFAEIVAKDTNYRLIIVAPHGENNIKRETLNTIRQSDFSDKVFVLGGMQNPYALMRHAEAFLFPSRYEGLGLVAFEALAAGTAVVSTDLPPIVQTLAASQEYPAEDYMYFSQNTTVDFVHVVKAMVNDNQNKRELDFNQLERQSLHDWEAMLR